MPKLVKVENEFLHTTEIRISRIARFTYVTDITFLPPLPALRLWAQFTNKAR